MPRSTAALAVLLPLVIVACGGGEATTEATEPSLSPSPAASRSARPIASVDPEGVLCLRVADLERRLASLRAIELRLPNRTALDIELDKLQAAYVELENVDYGASEERLEGSLKRLGYRLGELELAIEDFRTNSRPRRAVPNVEEDAQKVADELAAFVILSRC